MPKAMTIMKKLQRLPVKFSKNGLPYKLIQRNENVALFAVGGTYFPEEKHYEVIRILQVPEREIMGRTISAHEALPGNELFGRDGSRCINDPDRAEEYFRELTEKLKTAAEAPKDCGLKKNSIQEGVDTTLVVKSGAENIESNRISGS